MLRVRLPCEDVVPFTGKKYNRFVCGRVAVVFRYMRGRLGVRDKVGDGIIYVSVNGQCLGVFVWSKSLIVQRSIPRLVVSRIR